MCKKMTVAYGDYIGSRMVGWCVFNGKDYSFISDKTVKAKINSGDLVNGLLVDADGNVAIDQEFTKVLMGKSGLSFNPITAAGDDDTEVIVNKYYALVKVVKAKEGNSYHFITNRCGYEIFGEEQLKAMLAIVDTILRCNEYQLQQVNLPDGYAIIPYQRGFEADWARLECAVGDFSNVEEAVQYFTEKYLGKGNDDDILFQLNDKSQVIGSCIAWADGRQGSEVNSLHWLVVDELYQGSGFGRALCCEAMNRFYLRNQKPIYIHTQPWRWKAISLYVSLGFRLQKTDTFAIYTNQYNDAMKALKGVLSLERYHSFELASDN